MKQFSIVTMGVALTLLVLNACSDETPEQMQHPDFDPIRLAVTYGIGHARRKR